MPGVCDMFWGGARGKSVGHMVHPWGTWFPLWGAWCICGVRGTSGGCMANLGGAWHIRGVHGVVVGCAVPLWGT